MTLARTALVGLDLARNPAQQPADRLSFLNLETPSLSENSTASVVHETAVNGPFSAMKSAYERLEYLYYKHISLTFGRRIMQVQSGLSKVDDFFSSAHMAIDPFVSIFRNSVLSSKKLLDSFEDFTKMVKKTRLFSVFAIPFAIKGVVQGVVGLSLSSIKQKYADAGEHGLDILDKLGDFCLSVAVFTDGLKECGYIKSSHAFSVATTYLVGIGTILSIAAIGLQSKFIYESCQLKNRIIKVIESDGKADFKAIVDEFDKYGDKKLARRVGVSDGGKLKARMHAIFERNSNPTDDLAQKENLRNTMEALKTRIKWNNIGRYLKITAAVITMIASVILLATPGAPIGYALLAISSAVGIGVILMDYKTERNLNNHLKVLAPKDSPEMRNFYHSHK